MPVLKCISYKKAINYIFTTFLSSYIYTFSSAVNVCATMRVFLSSMYKFFSLVSADYLPQSFLGNLDSFIEKSLIKSRRFIQENWHSFMFHCDFHKNGNYTFRMTPSTCVLTYYLMMVPCVMILLKNHNFNFLWQ